MLENEVETCKCAACGYKTVHCLILSILFSIILKFEGQERFYYNILREERSTYLKPWFFSTVTKRMHKLTELMFSDW